MKPGMTLVAMPFKQPGATAFEEEGLGADTGGGLRTWQVTWRNPSDVLRKVQ